MLNLFMKWILGSIRTNMDKKLFSCGVFIDFIILIAFDTVDHKILLAKLNYYGFRGIVNQCFFSYLINRTQTTEIDLFTDTTAILN